MKKFVLVILMFCILFSAVAADFSESNSKKNEIQFKVGMFPAVEFFAGVFTSAFSSIGNESEDGSMKIIPSFTFEYLRNVTPKNAIGASVSWGMPAFANIVRNGEETFNSLMYVSLQFKYRRIYMDRPSVKLFGAVGLGGEVFIPTGTEDSRASPFVAFQLTPFGVWFGGEKFFGTAEVTVGSEGSMLTVGGGYRF